VWQKKTLCEKQAIDEFEDEAMKEQKDLEFLDSISDSTISVAKVLGPLFEPCFRECCGAILSYMVSQIPSFSYVLFHYIFFCMFLCLIFLLFLLLCVNANF